jgi:hypothetical protein
VGNPDLTVGGLKAQGGKELKAHHEEKRLTNRQRILAKCYECQGGYADGKGDCGIARCPLYPLMPYKGKKPREAAAA